VASQREHPGEKGREEPCLPDRLTRTKQQIVASVKQQRELDDRRTLVVSTGLLSRIWKKTVKGGRDRLLKFGRLRGLDLGKSELFRMECKTSEILDKNDCLVIE